MSLINDALKRATAEQPRATLPPGEVPPMQPVHTAPRPSSSPLVAGGIILVGIGAIGIAAALWFKGQTPTPVHAAAATQPTPIAAPIQSAQPTPQPQLIAAVQSSAQLSTTTAPSHPKQSPTAVAATTQPTKATPTHSASTTAANTTPKNNTTPGTTTPSTTTTANNNTTTQKPIRLQSIFYRLKNPTVILNGKTLSIGDTVDGIKVVSIQRTSVEVVQNGKYRTITLQD